MLECMLIIIYCMSNGLNGYFYFIFASNVLILLGYQRSTVLK